MIEKILSKLSNLGWVFADYYPDETAIHRVTKKSIPYDEVVKIVQEVAKDGGWIPVEEKNPTLCEFVYVTCISLVDERPPWVIEGIYGTEGWHGMSYMLRWGEAKVIAWMPKELPAPYQKGE